MNFCTQPIGRSEYSPPQLDEKGERVHAARLDIDAASAQLSLRVAQRPAI
jgi:hypothetical protein